METEDLLEELSARVGDELESVAEDRRQFLEGLRELQGGDVEAAAAKFRRASRSGEECWAQMARFGLARCEAVRGREGSALRELRGLAEGEGPAAFQQVVWMEIAALAKKRGDQVLWESARRGVEACRER